MACLVYIDETGSVGKGAKKQPLLTLMAVMVDEAKVEPLAERLKQVAWDHLGWYPADFEFHGNEVWNGQSYWKGKTPDELIAAYEAAIALLAELDLDLAHASIHKQRLHDKYTGNADDNSYRLALQFLLEKIDRYGGTKKILVADEAKEQRLKAIKMVADLQDWGGGEVPGRELVNVIDSLHFVESNASPGVEAKFLDESWSTSSTRCTSWSPMPALGCSWRTWPHSPFSGIGTSGTPTRTRRQRLRVSTG